MMNRIKKLSKPIKNVRALRKQFSTPEFSLAQSILKDIERTRAPRVSGKYNQETYHMLLEKYSSLPRLPTRNSRRLLRVITADLLGGAPLWRKPTFQYNVGAAVSRIASALYSICLDLNIFNINDGLSGNAIIAEQAVTRILAELAGVDYRHSCGFFTFGGTATNLYAIKLGLAKAFPESRRSGIPVAGMRVVLTEDSHFSHLNALNWLGVGVDNALIVKANTDRTSSIKDAELKLRSAFENAVTVPAIILNGGTTYDNVIDDIESFVRLRDDLVNEFKLDYVPHIHVDSVIGWAWLMFKGYDFSKNPLLIEEKTLELIKQQYEKISKLHLVDSWGVDFHKGIGSCPVPSSVIMINNVEDAARLSYKEDVDIHQLAREFSEFSPADYTLETSRPAGSALSALGALNALGVEGFQIHLANLVQQNQLLRELITREKRGDISILNDNSPSYVTMVRIYPPNLAQKKSIEFSTGEVSEEYVNNINSYLHSFFKFDLEDRMRNGEGVEYSYSSKYVSTPSGAKLGALKFYPTSPFTVSQNMFEAVQILLKQKDAFDQKLKNHELNSG